MIVSDYISTVSVLIALSAFIKSLFSGRKVKKLDLELKKRELRDREVEEAEKKKADINVCVLEKSGADSSIMRLTNTGATEARRVMVEILQNGEKEITFNVFKEYLPYPKVQPLQSFDIPYSVYGYKPHYLIRISWDDDYANGREKHMVVDL
ncbi:MAG: hypothetical protein J5771_03785 [Bacteroidales bacterium]|nr:hypothetical protein [Bacteroidales bacterium]